MWILGHYETYWSHHKLLPSPVHLLWHSCYKCTHTGVLFEVPRPCVMLLLMIWFFKIMTNSVNSQKNKLQLSLSLCSWYSPGQVDAYKIMQKKKKKNNLVLICKMEIDSGSKIKNRFLFTWISTGAFRSHGKHRTVPHSVDGPTQCRLSDSAGTCLPNASRAHIIMRTINMSTDFQNSL